MVMMDADVSEAGEVLTSLIALYLQIAISELNPSNIVKKNVGSCLHIINIKFSRQISLQGGYMDMPLHIVSY